MRCIGCKDVCYGPTGKPTGRNACNAAIDDCLNSCKNYGFPFNNVILGDCPPSAPSAPASAAPPPDSAAKTAAPHLGVTAAEQAARRAADAAGGEGGSDLIGPAATVAGAPDAAPDAFQSIISVQTRQYYTAHQGEIKEDEWG